MHIGGITLGRFTFGKCQHLIHVYISLIESVCRLYSLCSELGREKVQSACIILKKKNCSRHSEVVCYVEK